MQRIQSIFLILLFLSLGCSWHAQQKEDARRWGIEFGPVGIGIFQLFQGKATYLLWSEKHRSAEVGLGLLAHPQPAASSNEGFNSEGTCSAMMASLTYCQYYWRGLRTESVVNFGRGSVEDNIAEVAQHHAFQLFVQHFTGDKFRFFQSSEPNLYVIPQFGVEYIPLKQSGLPQRSKPFLLDNLRVDINP